MTSAPPDPMIGRLLDGRYQVRSRIARGGMATVYLATDLRLERRVAVKIMHGHLADDINFKNRFIQEARSAARLAHPNVVNVFDQGQDADMAYLVMEYLPGITLRDLLRDYGKLTPEQTVDILDAVLRGLASAHRAGIVHRDLKPENVLLADDGRIKLGDFGLARAATSNTASGSLLLGTIAYLSPELVTRGVADTRSDIYALGIMAFEMLTGEQPYRGEQPMQIAYQHANDVVPPPSQRVPDIPPQLDELVVWATAREPENRPSDAGEMLNRLIDIEQGLRPATALSQPSEASTALVPTQATTLLPASAVDETTVLHEPETRTRSSRQASGAVPTLMRAARTRSRKGWWLFSLVVVLASLVAGTGWYFGNGPGSLVTVPTVANSTPEAATAVLTELGFEVASRPVFSSTLEKDRVAGSNPEAGRAIARGAKVTLLVSQGRRPITLPALAGMTHDDAAAAIRDAGAVLASPVAEQFTDDVAAGIVLSAAQTEGDKADLSQGGDYFEGMGVALVVSAGQVPDVNGMTIEQAKNSLSAVRLTADTGSEEFSSAVPEGKVIGVTTSGDGPLRPGDTVYLTISKGPELFAIPDVMGKTKDEATQALQDAGFAVTYSYNYPFYVQVDQVPDKDTKVTGMSPKAGEKAVKGANVEIKVSLRAFS